MSNKEYYSSCTLMELRLLARDAYGAYDVEKYEEISAEIKRRDPRARDLYGPLDVEKNKDINSGTKRREPPEAPRRTSGSTILVLGIISLVLSLVLGIIGLIVTLIAWSMGDTALKQLKTEDNVDPVERSNTYIGRTCGMVGALVFLGKLLFAWLAIRLDT